MKKINVYYILLLVVILGCSKRKVSLVPTYNEGGYEFSELNITSEAHQDSVYISGKIFSADRSNNLSAMIQLGCYKVNTGDGHYNIKTAPFDGEYPLTATSIGYLTVETKPFNVAPGDSIVVNFYLAEDVRPIINCEGN